MYVCVYVYVYLYVHLHVSIFVCVYVHMYVCIYIHVCVHMYVYICMYLAGNYGLDKIHHRLVWHSDRNLYLNISMRPQINFVKAYVFLCMDFFLIEKLIRGQLKRYCLQCVSNQCVIWQTEKSADEVISLKAVSYTHLTLPTIYSV